MHLKKLIIPACVINVSNYRTRIREYVTIRTLYGDMVALPHVYNYYPGFRIYPLGILKLMSSVRKLVGQCIPLSWVPINMPVSYIYNWDNTKTTYIKSTGAKGIRRRLDKHTKLVNVLLPSGTIKLFSSVVFGTFSALLNLNVKKINEGGWGYSSKNKKVCIVRGVAKNPVDHPNGGRTKAKQPELSPWGWIAKQQK